MLKKINVIHVNTPEKDVFALIVIILYTFSHVKIRRINSCCKSKQQIATFFHCQMRFSIAKQLSKVPNLEQFGNENCQIATLATTS